MPETKTPTDLLDTGTVAERLGLTRPTVRALIQNGELEAINISPDPAAKRPRYRVRPDALTRFLDRRTTGKPAPVAKRRKPVGAVKDYFG
jgi:excisionase family DNA binding protein